MRIDTTSVLALLSIPVSLVVGLVSPQFSAALFVGFLIWLAISRRNYFHPAIFIGIGCTLFLLAGGLNISYYRGVISDEYFFFVFQMILSFTAGSALMSLRFRKTEFASLRLQPIGFETVVASTGLGVIGVLWVVAAVGIPLINPEARFSAPGRAMVMAESLSASLALLAYYYLVRGKARPSQMMIALACAVLFLLLIPGYRNWPLVAGLIAMIGLTLCGGLKISLTKLSIFGGVAVALLAAMMEFRRSVSSQLLASTSIIDQYRIEYLPAFLAQVHIGLRESLAIGERLITATTDYTGPPIFFGDFFTIFGQDLAGGRVIAQMIGAAQDGGLTPGLVGALTLEYGATFCYIFFFLAGVTGSALWNWFHRSRRPEAAFLYAFFLINFFLVFHRGIPKPGMVLVPGYFFMIVLLVRFLKPRSNPRTALPESSFQSHRRRLPMRQ